MNARLKTYQPMRTNSFIRSIIEEYRPTNDVFSNRSAVVDRVQRVVYSRLTPMDRNILLLYSEDASLAKTANRFNVSKTTMHAELRRIKNIIKNAL